MKVNDDEQLKFVLFGLGRIGTIHLQNLINHPNVKLAYLVEASTERAEFIRKQWNLKEVSIIHPDKADQIWTDNSIKCVVVCTPTDEHKDIVLKALQSGKAVLCEKV